MTYSMIEAIQKRHSVRTFLPKALEAPVKDALQDLLTQSSTTAFRFAYLDKSFGQGVKLGTYGMIKGANQYLVGIVHKEDHANKRVAMDFAEAFERIILTATSMGLGTCWMAGTYSLADVEKAVDLGADETVAIISPIGHGAPKKRLLERMSSSFARSDQRKTWEELFYFESFERPLTHDQAGDYAQALEMLRLAPSAVNMQPWRVVKVGERFDFYIVEKYAAIKKGQRIYLGYNDMGIGRCHFKETCKEMGLKGVWKTIDPPQRAGYVYVESFFPNL